MADQQHRFLCARTAQASDQIAFASIRPNHLHVARGIAGIAQTLGHRFRGYRRAAHGICGVNFDELLVNIARELIGCIITLREQTAGEK